MDERLPLLEFAWTPTSKARLGISNEALPRRSLRTALFLLSSLPRVMNTAITFHDLVSYSLGVNPNDVPVNIKRNGIYIPKPETVDQMELVDATLFRTEPVDYDDDDISTWEFHAPVASISWQSDASTCTSPSQTPAQDVVYRYRAGLKVDLGEPIAKRSSPPETKSDSSGSWFDDSASSSGTSFETSSTISSLSLPLPVQQEVRPLFRESRANALLDIRDEALAVIREDGLTERDPVVCHRPDCRDTLPNMKALMYHLHIHNMHDRLYQCDACGKRFESRRYLTMHPCPRLATSCPSSPIRDTFMRVLTKITSRE
ncbi:hypothetical protein B0H16DRAFT_1521020 [Mycena metata]|uniref:C2H2-type domain-containing protein n=1 Tax=Mycena metata TaxID=1033252 RepID=A0AAD7J3E4_9AGAR|nr:hypothetical protein B0H16DRAFT_1540722 [Mycena metata]KAJ7767144.1 hypothetical protein B0H16DRAFT_1521020 [Mycena metata]